MGNAHRGCVEFEVEGKQYRLRYSANALCLLEDNLDMGWDGIVEKMQQKENARVNLMRTVFWAGLTDDQEGITEKEAGRLMSELGFELAGELMAKAVALAFPDKTAAKSAPETNAPPQENVADPR